MPQWDDLSQLTWATQKKYCDQWGYKFHGDVSDVVLPLGTPWSDQIDRDEVADPYDGEVSATASLLAAGKCG